MSKLISPRRPAVRHTSYRLTKHADQRHAQNTLRKWWPMAVQEPVQTRSGEARERLADYDREGNAAAWIVASLLVGVALCLAAVAWRLR